MKAFKQIRQDLRLTTRHMSLLTGGNTTDIPRLENRNKHHCLTDAFYAILAYDPPMALRGMLFACLIFRRTRAIEEQEVLDLKKIAKSILSHGEYVTWEELFESRLVKHKQEIEVRALQT